MRAMARSTRGSHGLWPLVAAAARMSAVRELEAARRMRADHGLPDRADLLHSAASVVPLPNTNLLGAASARGLGGPLR